MSINDDWQNSVLCLEDGINPVADSYISHQSIYNHCLEDDIMSFKSKERQKEYDKNYHLIHKEKKNLYSRKLRKEHPEIMIKWRNENPDYDKDYYLKNKEKKSIQMKEWRKQHTEWVKNQGAACSKQWRENNPDFLKQWRKEHPDYQTNYRQTEKGRIIVSKDFNRRQRGLGFVPLNSPFPNSAAHHINRDDVIYIPEEIHRGIWHSIFTGKNMDAINYLAINYLIISQEE